MAFRLPTPTGSSVRNLHEQLIRDWGRRIVRDEQLRDIVHQRNEIELLNESLDRNMEPIQLHSGRAGGIIDHANGLLMSMPGFHAEPTSLTTADTREAESLERVAAALFQRELLANDFWPAVGRDVLIYGRGFVKALPMMAMWTAQAGYPVRAKKETAASYLKRIRDWKETEGKFPFVIQHVPALSILALVDTYDNVLATIEEKWVTARILADDMQDEEIAEMIQRRSINWYDELPVIEYIDSEHIAYLRAGSVARQKWESENPHGHLFKGVRAYKLLRTWKHNLGAHPVVMIAGIKTELPELEWHFKSFIWDAFDALVGYDFLLSRLMTMVYAYYLPSYEWQLAATSAQFAGRERPIMTVNLGGVTVTYSDEALKALPVPQGLPDANLLLTQLDDVIQRHTLEDVLFGRVPGSAPAFQVSLRINVAKSKLTPISTHLATGLTKVLDLFLRGVESLGEAVVIGGERVTTSTAKKYRGRLWSTILPKSPVDRNQDIGAANMALQFGLPWDWIVENILDIENPATLRLQKDIQELEQLPPVKERLMADALDQLEALVEEDEFMDAENIDLSQLPPEFAQAIEQLLGGGAGETDTAELIAGLSQAGPEGGLGRGPFPEGAAPQSLSPRGLTTQKTMPAPPGAEVGGESLPLGVPLQGVR